MHEASLRLTLGSPGIAAAVVRALAVEQADAPPGASVLLRVEGSDLVAELRAPDVPSLRATLAGVVRLADAASRSAALADPAIGRVRQDI